MGHETVQQLVTRFFQALRMEGAVDDYNFYSVEWAQADSIWKATVSACPNDAPAAEHAEIMLQHKGG